MSDDYDYDNLQPVLAENIRNFFCDLGPSTYDEVAPNIEYWIEYVLTEGFTTTDELVRRVSPMAWSAQGSRSDISRFLKEFRDAPRRSEQARSFVDKLCPLVLRWFAIASVENVRITWHESGAATLVGNAFIRAASFMGHLIESGLLGHDLVRRHLVKPLLALHYANDNDPAKAIRANAIYQLFIAAGDTLLQGVLEPGDVEVCFKILDSQIALERIQGLDAARLNELREIHAAWLQNSREEEPAGVPAGEVDTPVAFAPQDLPATHIGVDVPSSTLQGTEPASAARVVDSSPDTFVDVRVSAVSSPTLSISTISDLTPTEAGDDIGEGGGERIPTHHETFYFRDGNVEIICGDTVFRVHSTIISFASSQLQDILSQSTLLHAPMPEGCPRITLTDNARDFAVLLKMIYTPGFPARNRVPGFAVFASLLRMTTKYGFPDVREGLIEDLKGAYPTKWEDFETAETVGEDVFGSPRPHPNAVLNLFLEQGITFASPFAAYRAGLGGPSSLASDEPDIVLPRPILASIIEGMGEMRRVTTVVAHSIVYVGNLGVCPRGPCIMSAGTRQAVQRIEALNKVFNVMTERNEGDILSFPSLGNIVCSDCEKRLETVHLDWRKQFFRARLPRLLGWGGWREA